jgi:hypothetical protein
LVLVLALVLLLALALLLLLVPDIQYMDNIFKPFLIRKHRVNIYEKTWSNIVNNMLNTV